LNVMNAMEPHGSSVPTLTHTHCHLIESLSPLPHLTPIPTHSC
jgi:hypothetical protein